MIDDTAKPSSASAFGVMVVEDNIRRGVAIRFPSLNITLTPDRRKRFNGATQPDRKNEHP